MNKLEKFLARLALTDKRKTLYIIESIRSGRTKGFNINKLKGYKNIFRVKKGKLRIIYLLRENKNITILYIGYRDEKTYKRF